MCKLLMSPGPKISNLKQPKSYLLCVYSLCYSDPTKVLIDWKYLKTNLWRRTSLCWVGSKTEELWQRYSCQVIGALVVVILSSPQTVPRVWDFCRWVYWVWVKKRSNVFEQECTIKTSFFSLLDILIALISTEFWHLSF